jgi:FkbM family methyltransferase
MIKLLHLIPGQVLERLYYSRFSSILISIYDYLNKNENLKTHRIPGDLLMEIDLSKPAERAIPFNAFEPAITQNFLDIVREGGIVVDVGAWIGYYTILAARNAQKVVAVEADETNCQRIKRNVDLNSFSNVTILNVAVGDKSSQGVLIEGESSSTHKVTCQGIGKAIKIESLDNIINKLQIDAVNLLILDIEGYEFFALKGLQRSLSARTIKNVICEIHPMMLEENGISENDVPDLLRKYGYEVRRLVAKTANFKPYHIYAKPLSHKER